jgi:hypothetical protein
MASRHSRVVIRIGRFLRRGGRRRWRIGVLVMFLVSDAGAQITGAAIPFYGAGL